MGLPMARNLLLPAHTVTVYNRTPGRAKSLVAQGAKEAASVAEAIKNAEVVITMLSDDVAIQEVVHGPGGLLQNLPAKAIHLCMGTIDIETSAELAAAHAQVGQGYVAAPVFGRADAAASRHIWFVAGGMEPQVNRCRPIFEALGQGYTRVGPHAAQAHALKLGGNMLAVAMEMAVAETLTYAKKAGLPPADYFRFLNTAVFRSHMVDSYRGGTIRPSLDPEDKTLELAASEMLLQTAKSLGVTIPAADQLQARIQAATARGWGERDLQELTEACHLEAEAAAEPIPASDDSPGPGIEPTPEPISAPVPLPRPAPVAVPVPVSTPIPTPVPATVAVQSPPPTLTFVPDPTSGPEPNTEEPSPALSAPTKSPAPKKKKLFHSKQTKPPEEKAPQPTPPRMEDVAPPKPFPDKAIEPARVTAPPLLVPAKTYTALADGNQVELDLNETSHFELIKGRVWAWSQGKPYETNWSSLSQVEMAFNHILFLLIKRHVLLRPDAVLDMRPTFTGGAKARVSDALELDVGRGAARRLRELLGI